MPLPGRSFNSNSYRYGHNGQEKDDEIAQGIYTAEYWEYDSRTLRRWNTDPITKPWESPYACFRGNPIYYADPSGLDGEPTKIDDKGNNKDMKVKNPKGQGPAKPKAPSGPSEHMDPIQITSIPTSGTTPTPEITTPNSSPAGIPTVDIAGLQARNNTDLYSKFGVARNNPLFYNLAPVWKGQEYMNFVNFNQGSGSLSYGLLSVTRENNGKFSGSAGLLSMDEDGKMGLSHGYASVSNNSWDLTIASWEVSYDAFKTINGRTQVGPLLSVPTSTTIFRVTYINTTVLMWGSRHIIVDATTQFQVGQPYMWQTLKDTTTDFGRAPFEAFGVGVDFKTD